MNYTLNQLQIFLKIVETESITKAADDLHLTQPAVSIQLKNFQEQFDIPLTELVGRKIYVTDFGKEIAVAAKEILHKVDEINYINTAYKGNLAGFLKLSVVSTGKYVMPFFLTHFMQEHKGIELIMDVTNKSKVVESLESNAVDFALVSILPHHLHIEKLDLLHNKLYLVGNKYMVDDYKRNIDKLFEDFPVIFREKGSGTRQTMEKFLAKSNLSIVKKIELTSNEAVKQAIIAGLGFSVMPLIGIKNELLSGELKIINVKGLPIKTMWSLIWLKGKQHSPLSKALVQYLKKDRLQIVRNYFSWYEEY